MLIKVLIALVSKNVSSVEVSVYNSLNNLASFVVNKNKETQFEKYYCVYIANMQIKLKLRKLHLLEKHHLTN